VLSAIAKYHMTERGRWCVNDAMDIVGGKGICLGPNNWIGRGYEIAPVAITVEGANILTRSLIIFGQGAIRCHPYVLREMRAAKEMQGTDASVEFDDAFTSHVGHVLRNGIRAFVYGVTAGFAGTPKDAARETRHYYRHVSRLSAAFAFLADISMLAMGGALKRKEKISGRLGDVLSMMYLVSCTLKRYEDEGRVKEDLPLVRWSVRDALYRAQQALDGIVSNFPVKPLARLLRWTIFPRGQKLRPPLDSRNRECAQIALEPGTARERLTAGMYTPKGDDATGILEQAFLATVACEPIDRKLREGQRRGMTDPATLLTPEELAQWQRKEALRKQVIRVDDFPPDFGRAELAQSDKTYSVKAA
jgi:acyl-CoA dehydrogenase